jgi:hypothetical protein
MILTNVLVALNMAHLSSKLLEFLSLLGTYVTWQRSVAPSASALQIDGFLLQMQFVNLHIFRNSCLIISKHNWSIFLSFTLFLLILFLCNLIVVYNLLSLIWRNESRLMRSSCCLCFCVFPINFLKAEPIFIQLGIYIVAAEPISTAHFINPSHQSVCLYVYLPTVAYNFSAAMNTQATLEELLNTSFSARSM